MAKDLDSFIKDNQTFLTIEDGGSETVVYKGFTVTGDRYNPGKEIVSYMFTFPGSEKTIHWNKGSLFIASQMRKFGAGDTLKISRLGKGTNSKYTIEKVK